MVSVRSCAGAGGPPRRRPAPAANLVASRGRGGASVSVAARRPNDRPGGPRPSAPAPQQGRAKGRGPPPRRPPALRVRHPKPFIPGPPFRFLSRLGGCGVRETRGARGRPYTRRRSPRAGPGPNLRVTTRRRGLASSDRTLGGSGRSFEAAGRQ